MNLSLLNGFILFEAPYDKSLVEKCRSVRGRKFTKVPKVGWLFPMAEVTTVLALFPTAQVSPDLQREISGCDPSEYCVPPLPEGYSYRPYQSEGIDYLLKNPRALLLDDPGLGKTLECLSTVVARMNKGEVKKTLVICPSSVKKVWKDDAKKFFPHLKVQVFRSGVKSGTEVDPEADIYVTNFELLKYRIGCKPKTTTLRDPAFSGLVTSGVGMCIIDEIYRVKNRNTDTAKAIDLIHPEFKIGSTGTLIPKDPADAWFPINWVRPNLVGSYWDYLKRYAILGNDYSKWAVVGWKNMDHLKEVIQKHSIRRIKDRRTLPELPDRVFKVVYVEMTPSQKRLYKAAAKNWTGHPLMEELFAESTLTIAQRMSQIANQPAAVRSEFEMMTAKYDELDNIIAGTDDKVIVWSTHRYDLDYLRSKYGLKAACVFGGVSDVEREKAIDSFNNDPRVRIFIANPQSCREGITINASATQVWLNNSYNLIDWLQGLERNYRIGQERCCVVYQIVTEGTIEEDVQEVLVTKTSMAEYVTNPFSESTLKDWIAKHKA